MHIEQVGRHTREGRSGADHGRGRNTERASFTLHAMQDSIRLDDLHGTLEREGESRPRKRRRQREGELGLMYSTPKWRIQFAFISCMAVLCCSAFLVSDGWTYCRSNWYSNTRICWSGKGQGRARHGNNTLLRFGLIIRIVLDAADYHSFFTGPDEARESQNPQ